VQPDAKSQSRQSQSAVGQSAQGQANRDSAETRLSEAGSSATGVSQMSPSQAGQLRVQESAQRQADTLPEATVAGAAAIEAGKELVVRQLGSDEIEAAPPAQPQQLPPGGPQMGPSEANKVENQSNNDQVTAESEAEQSTEPTRGDQLTGQSKAKQLTGRSVAGQSVGQPIRQSESAVQPELQSEVTESQWGDDSELTEEQIEAKKRAAAERRRRAAADRFQVDEGPEGPDERMDPIATVRRWQESLFGPDSED